MPVEGQQKRPTVFISYAHESDALRASVKALADWLIDRGCVVLTDHPYVHRPPERGWPVWMHDCVREADVLLVVCTPKLKARYEKNEEPAMGFGATFEGANVTQHIYDAAMRNTKFFPIMPDGGSYDDVPTTLRPWWNRHSFPSGNEGIRCMIFNMPAEDVPAEPLAGGSGSGDVDRSMSKWNEQNAARLPATTESRSLAEVCSVAEAPPVRILHLSDFHFRASTGWDADPMLRALAKFIKSEVENGLAPDFVAITGDLAFSGKGEEYELAKRWLEHRLWPSLGSKLPRDRLLLVPGNHDVDRVLIHRGAGLIQTDLLKVRTQDEIAAVLGNPKDRVDMLDRHAAYLNFISSWFGTPQDLPWWQRLIEIRDMRLHVAGLNSAWMAGGAADRGNLLLGRYQLAQTVLAEQAERADWRIAMLHHPWNYLAEFDLEPSLDLIHQNCDLLLRGHLHKSRSAYVRPPDPARGCLELAAGCVYENSQYPNAFQWIELLPNKRIRVLFRAWLDNAWAVDRNQPNCPEGWAEFCLGSDDKRHRAETSADLSTHYATPRMSRARRRVDADVTDASHDISEQIRPDRTSPTDISEATPARPQADEVRQREKKEKRYWELKKKVAAKVRSSNAALVELESAMGVSASPGESLTEEKRAERLVDDLMEKKDFLRGKSALLQAYGKLKDQGRHDGADAIAGVSRFLIPWLFIAGDEAGSALDKDWWLREASGKVLVLPTSLKTFAEIVMAGLDRREVKYLDNTAFWPIGKYAVALQPLENGMADSIEVKLRGDLFRTFKAPLEHATSDPETQDKSIVNMLNHFSNREGRTPYLICIQPKEKSERDENQARLRRIAERYPSLAIVELGGLMGLTDQELFNDIRDLLLQHGS